MKKGFFIAFILLSSSLLIFGCRHSAGDDLTESGKAITLSSVKFNVGSFNALAVAGEGDGSRSAARSATTDGMIVKILENGGVENFITTSDRVNLAPVNYIAHSPAPNAKEIYIVFNYETSWWDDNTNYSIGQLLCVLEDGSFYDVLAIPEDEREDNNYNSHKWLYNSSSQDSIAFDNVGMMYYLVSENSGNSNTNVIYKFNPETGVSTQLTQSIENTYYEKMQVSKDGAWIFTKANRWMGNSSTNFLRAIPTNDPEQFINLFYTSNGGSWINDWFYDDDDQTMYYIQDGNLFSIPLKDGTFSKDNRQTVFAGSNGGQSWFYSDSLFTWNNRQIITWRGYNSYNNHPYYFRNPDSAENEVQPEEILAYIKAYAAYSMADNVSYNPDSYKISFKKFADVPGAESLATVTKGKYDLDAINAIIDNGLEEVLYNLLYDNGNNYDGWYSRNRYYSNFYEHNFYADVLYDKSSENPIDTSLFKKQTYGNTSKYYTNGIDSYDLFTSDWANGYTWKSDFTDNGKVDAEKVLKTLADYCGKSEIEFSLEAFKGDSKYYLLYTDLKDEDAVKFLDTPSRLEKLGNYLCDNEVYDNQNAYGKFLLKTCFVKDSNYSTPAYTWRTSDTESIWWGNVNNLTPSYKKSLYGVFSNSDSNGLIKIIDEEGRPYGSYVQALNDYKVTSMVASDKGFYFKRALLDSNKEETGNHQILYYDAESGTCTNYFDNVQNNEGYEIVSFSVGGNYIYYCAAQGFNTVNGKIDIATKTATVLSTNTKFTQIITVK
ncbi:MAG: hypothetical protein J6J00_01540 [Treponema sp.]|nr:hypothetical protein [Treponema sp.]